MNHHSTFEMDPNVSLSKMAEFEDIPPLRLRDKNPVSPESARLKNGPDSFASGSWSRFVTDLDTVLFAIEESNNSPAVSSAELISSPHGRNPDILFIL